VNIESGSVKGSCRSLTWSALLAFAWRDWEKWWNTSRYMGPWTWKRVCRPLGHIYLVESVRVQD